jgi:uncharacterized membrane protein
VRWVDRIARLGRLGTTVDKVEAAAAASLGRRRTLPTLRGARVVSGAELGVAVYSATIGYVQRVDIGALQAIADDRKATITVDALPGVFAAPGRAVAYIRADAGAPAETDTGPNAKAFRNGDERIFDDDPRFGLIVLSEIASRALSPAVNDPGTAIDIIGTFVRLFAAWGAPLGDGEGRIAECGRVQVPELLLRDMFDDAFTGIARDGAGAVEVGVRLQKAFKSLASFDHPAMQDAARHHARQALDRATRALTLPDDVEAVRAAATLVV